MDVARRELDRQIRDLRASLAIARVRALESAGVTVQLERRIEELEAELRRRYSQLLELKATLVPHQRGGAAFDYTPEDLELRDLYRAIQSRRTADTSLATVIIPAYGKPHYTLRCLRSIAETWSYAVHPAIVIVDDASPDESAHRLLGIPGVDVICNGTNEGYLRSTNRGIALAKTRYVCLLNNDTEVKHGWLEALVQTANEDAAIGAVGSKLVYPDGKLQEAGGIIWSDASGWNYGRGDDPAKPAYNTRRDVDYCSAASLLVRTDVLREIGGFDERFAPAYYEDADLCFALRFRGYRVVYEPRSEVVHYEGISSGTDITTGVKRFQEINRPKFAEKWATVLPSHLPPAPENVERALYRSPSKRILIVDSYVPQHDREAGSNRLFKIVRLLREMKYHVMFLPDNGAPIEPYSTDLARLGVEVLYAQPGKDQESLLTLALRRADLAWICRPELCEKYLPLVRAESQVPIVYDTIDLHFMREKRRAEIEGTDDGTWRRLQDIELSMARAADLVVTVTDVERRELESFGITSCAVIPTIHDVEPHAHFSFSSRSGVLFIGGYNHTPNVDAALWFCNDIMPIIWQREPAITVTLLGSNPPPAVTGAAVGPRSRHRLRCRRDALFRRGSRVRGPAPIRGRDEGARSVKRFRSVYRS